MGIIGLNVQAQALSGSQKQDHLAYVRRNQPWAELVMDDFDHAVQVRQANPKGITVFRDNERGGNNNAFRNRLPFDVVNGHQRCIEQGLLAYIGNEDGWHEANIEWQLQVARYANDAGLECVFVNGGPGQPQPDELARGHIDPLIVECTHHHYLSPHEYAPWDLRTTDGFLIGRHQMLEDRRQLIWNGRPPTNRRWLLITEFGYDIIDGQGHPLIELIDLLRNAGLADPEGAIFEQVMWAAKIYYLFGPVAGVMWYCYGAVPHPADKGHAGQHWGRYDILKAPRLLDLIADADWPQGETMFDPNDIRWISVLMRSTHNSTNVRTGPSTAHPKVAAILATPIPVRMLPAEQQGSWLPLAMPVAGVVRSDLWVHRDYVVETDATPTFTGIPLPEVHLDRAERDKMAAIFDWLGGVFRNEENWS